MKNYQEHLQSTSSATSNFGTSLKNIGGTLLSTLTNAGINLLISLGINAIGSLIDDLVVTKKEIKELAQTAQSNIDTVRTEFTNLSDTVDSIGESYARLRQGVQQTNSDIRNIDLSQSEYEEFLSLSNQIANLAPELVSGYDAQGNAILNLKGDYDSIIQTLETFIEKQRESMNIEITQNLPDLFKGVKQDSDDYIKQIDSYQKEISSLEDAYKSLNDESFVDNFAKGFLTFDETDIQKYGLLVEEYTDLLKSLNLYQYANAMSHPEEGTFFVDFSSAPKEEIQRAMSELSSIAAEYQVQIGDLTDQVQQTTQKNAENWASLKDEMFAALSVDDSYKILSDQAKSDVQSIINNMDWGSLISNNDISEWSDLESWINDNVLSLFSGNNADSIQQAIAKAFDLQDALKSGEKSIGEYQKEISSILDSFDDLDDATKDAIKVSLEFTGEDGSDLDTMINNVQGKLSDEFDDMVETMSYDDLVFAYKIENNGDMTWDELQRQIENAHKVAENGIDINSRINLENYKQAGELDSYRADYDSYTAMMNAAQELFEAGEIGDERFKAAAKAFSENGMDDAINWQENYGYLSRYFTEGSEGLETFVQEMSKFKDESGEAFATWDDASNSWRLNLSDMTGLAEQLHMPLEMVSVLLEGLQQYGFTNDYFGTMEDGVSHLTDLYTQLADEQYKLTQMEETGVTGTALDQQREKVEQLKSSIEITKEGMNDLLTMTNESLDAEYQSAKDAAQMLVDAYNNIDWDSDSAQFQAQALEDAISQIEGKYGIEIDIEGNTASINTTLQDLESEISSLQERLNSLRSSDGTLNFDDSEVQQVQNELASAIQQKQQLTQPAIMSVDTSQLNNNVATAVLKLQEIQTLANEIEVNKAIGLDTSQAEANLSSLVSEYNQLSGSKTLGIELSANVDQIQQAIAGIQVEDLTQVIDGDNTKAKAAIDEAKQYAARGVAQINVSANTSAAEAKLNALTRTRNASINYTVSYITKGGTTALTQANGTAHADGTVGRSIRSDFVRQHYPIVHQAYYGGDWGIPYDQTALVGEIGPELLVRDGKWQLIGQRGPGFQGLKRGDIIFNSAQTEQIFKNGWVTGRGKTVGFNSHAMGTVNPRSFNNAFYGGSTGSFGGAPSMSESTWGSGNSSSNSSSSSKKTSSSSNKSQKEADEFIESLDEIEIKIDRIERAISQLDLKASSAFRTWGTRAEALGQQMSKVAEEIDIQQQGYERYLAQADSLGLSADWVDKIQSGRIDIETITDEDLYDKIQEYADWYSKALDCRDAIEELKEAESELYQASFDNLLAQYDEILQGFDHRKNMIDEYINQAEEKGYIVSTQYYQAQIDAEQQNLAELQKKKAAALAELQNALASRTIAQGSEAWYDMCEQIDDVTLAIEEANTALIEYNNSIRDVNWEVFDLLQDRISNITKESDFLIDLFDHDKLYDDRGQLTDEGMSTMGLHGVNYNVYMAQADKYAQEIQKINQELANDPYDQELVNRRQELLELQQDMITAAEDEKEAIRDMVEEGINLELDALQELIDKYTEALQSQKDLYDYQQKIAEQTENLASLEKQMAAYAGDDSEETRAKRQQLATQIEDARKNLADTEYDQSITDQQKLLEELYTQYEEILNLRLDDLNALITDMIGEINNNAGTIASTITEKVDSLGYTLSDSMTTIWDTNTSKLTNVVTVYGQNIQNGITSTGQNIQNGISNATTTVNNALNTINVNIQNMLKQLGSSASSQVSNKNTQPTSSTPEASTPTPTPTPPPTPDPAPSTPKTGTGNGTPEVGDQVTFNSGLYYENSYGQGRRGYYYRGKKVYITGINLRGTHPYHISSGSKMGQGDLGWLKLNQISGYKLGGKNLPGGLAWTQEDGDEYILRKSDGAKLTLLSQGDSVLNHQASNVLYDMANSPKEFLREHLPEINRVGQPNSYTQNLDKVIFEMPNVKNYEELLKAMKSDQNFERLIHAMTVDQLADKSSLRKYKAF